MAIKVTAGQPTEQKFYVEPGEYDFRVLEAKDDTSKAGNEMTKLHLRILNKDGTDGPACYDYLIHNEKNRWKVNNFLAALDFDEGAEVELGDELVGMTGRARFIVEEYDGKKNNKVADYLSGF